MGNLKHALCRGNALELPLREGPPLRVSISPDVKSFFPFLCLENRLHILICWSEPGRAQSIVKAINYS